MNIARRQETERQLVTAVVEAAFKAGYVLVTDNDPVVHRSNVKRVVDSIFETDETRLYMVREPDRHEGGVLFVMGNDGWDVICDWTTNLNDMMKPILKLADQLCERDLRGNP